MKKHKNSKKYAKMFLNSIGIENAPDYLGQLAVASTLMAKSPEFKTLVESPMFNEADRAKALEAVGQRIGLSGNIVKFISFLSAERAAGALADVLEKAIAIYSEKKARVKATIISAGKISDAYGDRLKASLKKITQKDVDVEYAVDPSLLGGILIKVGSTMFDGSLKGQIRQLREELIKG